MILIPDDILPRKKQSVRHHKTYLAFTLKKTQPVNYRLVSNQHHPADVNLNLLPHVSTLQWALYVYWYLITLGTDLILWSTLQKLMVPWEAAAGEAHEHINLKNSRGTKT